MAPVACTPEKPVECRPHIAHFYFETVAIVLMAISRLASVNMDKSRVSLRFQVGRGGGSQKGSQGRERETAEDQGHAGYDYPTGVQEVPGTPTKS